MRDYVLDAQRLNSVPVSNRLCSTEADPGGFRRSFPFAEEGELLRVEFGKESVVEMIKEFGMGVMKGDMEVVDGESVDFEEAISGEVKEDGGKGFFVRDVDSEGFDLGEG